MANVATIDQLHQELTERLDGARITIDAPDANDGVWWIDVQHRGRRASIEFRPGKGFGVSGPNGGYGEGPDAIAADAASAADQVIALLVASRLEKPVR